MIVGITYTMDFLLQLYQYFCGKVSSMVDLGIKETLGVNNVTD